MKFEFDATFTALLALVVFIGLLIYLKVPGQVFGILDKQSAAIKKELDDAHALREQAEALKAEYESKLHHAEIMAREMISAAKAQAEALSEEARRQMALDVERRTAQAQESIARAELAATAEVRNAAVDAAIEAARAALQADLRPDAHTRLVEAGVAELAGKFR